jgi:hypothetical protein
MTTREQFAMAAVQGIIANQKTAQINPSFDEVATLAIKQADALIAKLAEGQPDLDAMALVLSHEGHIEKQDAEIARLRAELNKVGKNEHPFCSYCFETIEAKTADDLKAHIMVCPEHPLPAALRLVAELDAELAKYTGDLTDEQAWQAFNDTPLIDLGDGPVAMVRAQDAAVRKVRSGEGE